MVKKRTKKNILEHKYSKQLAQLCSIIIERNEICRRRNSIRYKLYRLNKVRKDLTLNNEIKRNAAIIRNSAKRQLEFEKQLKLLVKKSDGPIHAHSISNTNLEHLAQKTDRASRKLQRLGDPVKVPKKYQEMKRSDLLMQIALLKLDLAQVTIDQYEFTSRTRGILADLTKKFNIKMIRNRHLNRYDRVILNEESLSIEQLEKLHVGNVLEQELLSRIRS